MLEKFIKSYSGTYQHTAMLRHKGMVIAFAMDAGRRIWYTVLNLSGNGVAGTAQKPTSFLDVDSWQSSPTELSFPNEIAEVGFGVAGQAVLPVFKKNSALPEVTGTILPSGKEDEYDYFKSTTARFTELAPFQVLSDGRYVYIFRQAIGGTNVGSMVYVDDDGHLLVNKNGVKGYIAFNKVTSKNEWIPVSAAQTAPLVNATLLVDRFVLVGTKLAPKMEVRYQRSRSKARPASRKDGLGPKDLDGNLFYEPTQELKFIGNLKGGCFSVLLLPTAIAEIQRWQIFAENGFTGRMDSYNVERSADGLFNTRGSQVYTCVDHTQVYARRAGNCTECGKTLIPRIVNKGNSESALKFDGVDDHVKIPNNEKLNFTKAITVEAWIKPDEGIKNSCIVGMDGYSLYIDEEGRPAFAVTINKTRIEAPSNFEMIKDTWYHIAGAFDGSAVRVYVNGNEYGKKEIRGTFSTSKRDLFIGRSPGKTTSSFAGTIDEVRLWQRARSGAEVKADMHQRLTGLEPDLAGYWRFDEGYGPTVHDQTNNQLDGTAYYDENKPTYKAIKWTASDAPVGEHPGVERVSFQVAGRTFTSPPTSLLYYQQSKAASGYSGEAKPLKNSGRVMLALATNDGSDPNKNHIAALDFGVSPSGRLAQIPDEIELSLINAEGSTDQSLNDQLDRLSGLQTELLSLNDDISGLEDSIAHILSFVSILENALENPASITANITDSDFSYLNGNLQALKDAKAAFDSAATTRQGLDNQLNHASMYVYEDAGYTGSSLGPFKLGFIGYTYLASQKFNDIISSIYLDEPLQVSVYEHANREGKSVVFSVSTANVGSAWNDKISSMDVQENSAFEARRVEAARKETDAQNVFDLARTAVTNDLSKLQTRLTALQQEKNTKETRKAAVQQDLSHIQDGVKNGASVTMSRAHTDPLGLTISGSLLGFAWTDDAPLLFDSATGTLALYFRGRDNQFFVAYYDTFTERAKVTLLSGGKEAVSCFSMSTAYEKIIMEVEGDESAAVCTVLIGYDNAEGEVVIKETWNNVPRAAYEFSSVLNGQATGRSYIGSGQKMKDGELTLLEPGARRAINTGTTLMVGDERVKVSKQVFVGDKRIQFNGSLEATESLPIFFVEYDYPINATCEGIRPDLSNGSVLIRAVTAGTSGTMIPNQIRELAPSQVCKWTAAAPGSTISFNGKKQFAEIADAKNLDDFDAAGDLTLEAWVKPSRVENQARVIQHRSDNSSYLLALEKRELMSALMFMGSESITIAPAESLTGTFTVEAWVKPNHQTEVIGVVGSRSPNDYSFDFKFQGGNKIHGDIGDGVNWLTTGADALFNYEDGVWYHVAYVVTGSKYAIFVDGIEKGAGTFNGNPLFFDSNHKFHIGYTGHGNERMKGAIDDVRIWKRARTQQEIQTDLNRRLNGNETDLIGYWHFDNGEAKDYSRYQNNGTIIGQSIQTTSPLPAYAVVAGVGEKFVKTREIVPAGNWTHLAAAFSQAYGLKFDGGNYLDCGNDPTLDINQDLTIEVSLQVGIAKSQQQVLVRRGAFVDSASNQHVPYSLSLDTANRLAFSFEDVNEGVHTYTSSELTPGFHKVAVTRERKTKQENTGTEKNPSVKITAWDKITFYIDGKESGSADYESNQPETDTLRQPAAVGKSNKPVTIGNDFQGVIAEVRIWNTARAAGLSQNLTGDEKEPVAWWRFQEGRGDTAFDSKGQNHAKINGARWVKSPDPQASNLMLYISGQLKVTDAAGTPAAGVKRSKSRTALGERLQGELEEVRIWQTTRTEEQIQDNLFRRIEGEKEDLIAYYNFDVEEKNQVSDYGLRGNHLTVKEAATLVLSTAPIGDDTPQVRSALAGIRTPFSGRIGSAPSVQEYGDIQFDSQGNLIGAFKRCYSFILDGKWQIVTGYKVGDMVTEWIGQVQFAPQLIGFIEGAPPVPSENLTQPSVEMIGDLDDYNQASVIELVEAEETTHTYSATKEGGFDMEVEFGLKFGAKSESEVGFIAITNVEESTFLVGLRGRFEASWGWLEEASAAVSRATGKTTSLELRGRYTTPKETEHEPFGRRFVPDNVGLAVVQSETADVFALRLRHNGALIAFQMRPNPDIPKDWNIIHFPINPRYVKQGALDGKIGPVPDVDYPNALAYSSDSSYFKPLEAYALKNRITREESALQTYYDQYAAQDKGRPASMPSESAREIAGLQALTQQIHRNLVNTYVWTADGGLFAETQQTMDVQTETYGGSYDFKGMGGTDLTLAFAIMKVAMQFELNAMFGGHQHLSVNKSKESKTAFQLNVNLDKVERDIYQRDPNDRKIVLLDESDPKRPKPIKSPYKVDAYRFMSFYLEPEYDHHDQFYNRVVDPMWLEQSDDPGAVALRAARDDGKKPACWRVMHRVTYISRVLPPLDLSAPPSLEKTLQTLDIDSNYELIKQLEPYVRDHLADFADFSTAVDDALKSCLPELIPHRREIKGYLSLYYGIDEGYQPESQVEGFGEGPESRPAPNKPPTVKAGQYPVPLLLTGNSIVWSPDPKQTTVRDDRVVKVEDLFLTWEFLPGAGQKATDIAFDNPHMLNTTATFVNKGMYRLRLTASDGILSASDETVIIVNQTPVIESITAGKPVRGFSNNELFWTVNLDCKIRTGLGNPLEDTGLTKAWKIVSGSAGAKLEIVRSALSKDDDGILEVQTQATFRQSGYYLLEFTVGNGIDANSQVNLEIAARVTDGLQALYTFEAEGATVQDVSGLDAPLDLSVSGSDAVKWVTGGMEIHAPVFLSSKAQRLTEAIRSSNGITLEAWIKPRYVNLSGLRRILTLSNGPSARDFILGQSGSTYHVGLRTTDESVTDVNASLKSMAGGDVKETLTHVVFTREAGGPARLYINGAITVTRTIRGNFSQWREDGFQLALGDELNSDGGSDRAWAGEYHLVAIYNRALTLEEVNQNFEFGADRDLPPHVSAGKNREINWSVAAGRDENGNRPAVEGITIDDQGNLVVKMQGHVMHDRPANAGSIEWTQVSGPKDCVRFTNANDPETQASFSRSGAYGLRLTADDGGQVASKEVTITITHEKPLVHAGEDKTITHLRSASLKLDGAVKNSLGDHYPTDKLRILWRCDSGDVTIESNDKLAATATFANNGVYELKLTATNVDEEALTASDTITITVNQAPVVDAGLDQMIILPAKAALDATVSDDGLPDPPGILDLTWSDASSKVTFANAKANYTTASFTDKGTYTLKLEASDGAATSTDEVTIIVNKAPVVETGLGGVVKYNEPIPLDGSIRDDGFGNESQRVPITILWEMESGPVQPVFADAAKLDTTVTFPQKGVYMLKVTAKDAYGETGDTVTFTVNEPPKISAGEDQTVGKNSAINLMGRIDDNGLGNPVRDRDKLGIFWELVSGPSGSSISNANTLSPTVSISSGNKGTGTYEFKLIVTNATFSESHTVTIKVS